jgi:hypothetical protein
VLNKIDGLVQKKKKREREREIVGHVGKLIDYGQTEINHQQTYAS